MNNYVNVMQSKETQEYFDIRDRRIPELQEADDCLLLSVNGYLQPVELATLQDYDNLIGE